MRRSRRLHIIPPPPPESTEIARSLPGLPIVTGNGNADYGCGACGSVLLCAVTASQVSQQVTVVQCGRCGAFNRGGGLAAPATLSGRTARRATDSRRAQTGAVLSGPPARTDDGQ